MPMLPKIVPPSDCSLCQHRFPGMFCDFSPKNLADFNTVGRLFSFPAGAILMREEDPANQVFVICRGQVKLSCVSKEGRTLNLKIAVSGEVLGLSAVISGSPFEVTAETMAPTDVSLIPRDDFLAFIRSHGEASLHAAHSLAAEYKSALSGARSLALSGSVAGRVARLLLDWGNAASSDRHETWFNMDLTHEDLADFAGATRETITRTLGRFQKDKLIQIRGVTVHILLPEKLADLAA